MAVRFSPRSFLCCFIPIVVLFSSAFWMLQRSAVGTIRQGLSESLREKQVTLARLYAKSELRNSRFLQMVSEDAALKSSFEKLRAESRSRESRREVEDQLRRICETLGYEFLVASTNSGEPLAGVMRDRRNISPMDVTALRPPSHGFYATAGRTYHVTSAPIQAGDESIGILSLGEHFDFADLNAPAVLIKGGQVVKTNLAGFAYREIESALASCRGEGDCELRLRGEAFVSLPMDKIRFGDGYVLRCLRNMDAASEPMLSAIRHVSLMAIIAGLLACLGISAVFSITILRPLAGVVSQLKANRELDGDPMLVPSSAVVPEIGELIEELDRSFASIRKGRDNLRRNYVEFAGLLANVVDARDAFTAGHSRRVSEYACAIARAIELPASQVERLRTASLLHDIGKIGTPDRVLERPGRLTPEEFAVIREHCSIGRRILEGLHGFEAYLTTVEFHHENWDGSGYPRGLAREAIPLEARIVRVADAYEAMTADRAYRRGMSHEQALRVLEENAGTQFDPAIVSVFVALGGSWRAADEESPGTSSVERLAAVVNRFHSKAQVAEVSRGY